MQSATYHLSIGTARADALFASARQRSDEPSPEQICQAIAAAVRAFGARGCAARRGAGLRRAPGDRRPADALGAYRDHRRIRRCPAPARARPRARSAHQAPHLPRGVSHPASGLAPDPAVSVGAHHVKDDPRGVTLL